MIKTASLKRTLKSKFALSEIESIKERDVIFTYFEKAKVREKQEPLFIYGFPGSGKTYLIKQMIDEQALLRCDKTLFVYLNVLYCNSFDEITDAILEAINKVSDKMYSKAGNEKILHLKTVLQEKTLVLVFDEITENFVRIKGLFYNLVDYQSNNKNLNCVFISNNSSFFLDKCAKIWSRAGNNKLHFSSKTDSDIARLIKTDFEFYSLFEEDAFQFIVIELINKGNDIRKLCHFVDYVYKEKLSLNVGGSITTDQVRAIFNEIFGDIDGKQLKSLSLFKKSILTAFVYPNDGKIASLVKEEDDLFKKSCRILLCMDLPADDLLHFDIFRSELEELIRTGLVRKNANQGRLFYRIGFGLVNKMAEDFKQTDFEFCFTNFENLKIKLEKK